ncbi:MAG: PKD domain-containing protein, partial [Thermoplasmata archaeon]|nr:PKD domain-containing protein [Thermoplasmata archaeon]
DGDELTYTWYLVGGAEDKVLGTGKTIETKDLKAGNRLVEVEVEDGNGGTATASHTIKVKAVEETSGIGMWLGIIIVVVIAIVVALVVMMKRGKPDAQPEAGMDIESLQQEYDPTQGRGGTEPGKTYDSSQGDWESLEEK